jgi:solute carrier family 45, member 1/2/4
VKLTSHPTFDPDDSTAEKHHTRLCAKKLESTRPGTCLYGTMADGDELSPRGDEAEDSKKTPLALLGETPTNAEGTSKPIHEESPLLSASGDEEDDDLIVDDGGLEDDHDDYHDTKSLWYMILLTISIGGLQLAWAVELSNGTPYLLSLGLSKSLMALVWIAGPLSGALVQPYVGILSDNCRSSWGKRTPFMITGSAATIISLLALAWAREIVGGCLSVFGVDRASQGVKVSIIVFAVLWVYILDFSINTGMSFCPSDCSMLMSCSTSWH